MDCGCKLLQEEGELIIRPHGRNRKSVHSLLLGIEVEQSVDSAPKQGGEKKTA